ncbi:MAG: type II secretion system GspH family protein [Planctomycetes bacterium]|nr:type II secretion system GspH family protein [Planctomycetota bacterium]
MTRRNRGFTLIELLVVIAIIALLMSILMPALARVRKQAQSVTCMSQIRTWGLLYKLYTDDNSGFFPEGWGYADQHPGTAYGEYGLWMNSLRPYYKDQWKLLKCPTATRVVLGSSDWGTFKAWYGTFQNRYPAAGEAASKLFEGSYGTSNWIDNMAANRGARLKEWFWKSAQNVTTPNQVPVISDNTWHDGWPLDTDTPVAMPLDYGWGDKGTTGEMNQCCIDRHNGSVNFAFADWSARRVGLKELWTLRWHRAFKVNGPWTKAGGVSPDDWPQWLRKYKDY